MLHPLLQLATPISASPGQRLAIQQPSGSGDAWLLAALANTTLQASATKPMLIVVCAQASDANRLAEEIKCFAPALRCMLLPDWETLPYDSLSPHQDLISERLATLYALSTQQVDVLCVAASTVMQRLAPPSFLIGQTFFFKVGESLRMDALRAQLTLAGYQLVSQVMSPGEYAIRGGIVDLFPTGSVLPYRFDLFGDEIESIKTFDIDTQRSLYPVPEIRLLPGREFPFDESSRAQFRTRWRERFEGDPSKHLIYRDVGSGIASAGIEYYLPMFFEQTASLFDYLTLPPDKQLLVHHGDIDQAMQAQRQETQQRYNFLSKDSERPILPPDEIFLRSDDYFGIIQPLPRVQLSQQANALAYQPACLPLPALAIDRKREDPAQSLRTWLTGQQPNPRRSLIVAESHGRRETLLQLLEDFQLKPEVFENLQDFLQSDSLWGLAVAELDRGFQLGEQLAVITESELFASILRRQKGRRQERSSNIDAMIRDLAELKTHDPVVHQQHGIGRYRGLTVMDLGEGPSEFLHLEYAQGATLFVPVAQLHVISRYSGADPDAAPLHQLGSGQWEKARRKAAEQIRDTAAELLNLYARRAVRQGHACKLTPHDYAAFVEAFGFEETADQRAAIEAVIADMTSPRPMDRLICGDVGFGKTEVALRAAFIAAMDGQQVVVLAPTTLLAEQHCQTFRDRFSDWPVKIAELSRFRSAKEIQAAITQINAGQIDIMIGTHKLLSPDIKPPQLGLIIIDEEHRFGVRQKEAIRNLRAEVDVLTLTATPIPRTLAMSMEGIRDFSVIATAPQRRLAIKTFVRRESEGIIREAVLRELKRGGQVYFLHNEVETIQNRREMLERLLPEARIAVAHGQMAERELEQVMRDFYQQRFNILLCTTIIETGIDIPTANTIIMHRADKFGLAQLHQLRGRVGRSHHQAYAYLLVHSEEALTKQAKQRLEAITMMEELGSGFYLAMHDLEIRGAGEVLGENQSGNVQEIGFQMYTDMLNAAVRSLRQGKEPDLMAPLSPGIDINLRTPALLPNDYCADVHERLVIYKRLASASCDEDLDDLQEELIDRFGPLPEPAQALLQSHRLRLRAEQVGIIKIDATVEATTLQFSPQPPVNPANIMNFLHKHSFSRLLGPDRVRLQKNAPALQDRVLLIKTFINAIQ